MKIYINIRPYLLACFLFSTLAASGQTDKSYTGYRVYLADFKVLNQTDQALKVAFQAVNTGRQDLEFGKEDSDAMQKMVVRFDPLFEKGKMYPHLTAIITSLKKQDFAVVAGKIGPRREMEVSLTNNNDTAPTPKEEITEITTPDPVSSVPEEIPLPPTESEIVTTTEPTLTEATATEMETQVAETDLLETESAEAAPTDDTKYYDPETCPDLRIESIRVLKQKRNYVMIEYTIKNVGKGPADIEGVSRNKEDNIAVKAFMTSSDKLTKGALVLGGDVVANRSKDAGPLLPGETHTTKIRIDTNTMTKFTPVIILELDTFGQIRECDETNNKNHIKVR